MVDIVNLANTPVPAGTDLLPMQRGTATATNVSLAAVKNYAMGGQFVPPSGDTTGATDLANIQAAINALGANGGGVFLNGIYYITGAGLSIQNHAVCLIGVTESFFGAPNVSAPVPGTGGTAILYNGTGTAITFGSSTLEGLGSCGIQNIQIEAVGAALTSATAIGVVTNNCWQWTGRDWGVSGFGAGVGFQDQGNGTGNYSGGNISFNVTLIKNKIGFRSTTTGGAVGANLFQFYGGQIQGTGYSSSGSIAIDIGALSNQNTFDAVYINSAPILVNCAGQGNTFMGCTTEFSPLHFDFTSGTFWNSAVGHRFNTAGGDTLWTDAAASGVNYLDASRSGTGVNRIGTYTIKPPSNQDQVFSVANATGQVQFDISTASGNANIGVLQGSYFGGYTDAFATQAWLLRADDGSLTARRVAIQPTADGSVLTIKNVANTTLFSFNTAASGSCAITTANWGITTGGVTSIKGLTVQPAVDSSTLVAVNSAGGSTYFGISTTGIGAVNLYNGPNLALYSDTGSTQTFNIAAATGILQAYSGGGVKVSITPSTATINLATGGALTINSTQVVAGRITGWGAPSGGSRAALAAGTATLAQTAAAVAQLIADLSTHGLIGP